MVIEGAIEPTPQITQITIDSKDPVEAIKQFEASVAQGQSPIFSDKTAKAVQKYVEIQTKQSLSKAAKQKTVPREGQIKIGAGIEGKAVLESILKAKAAGLNVELSPEAREALAVVAREDLAHFVLARVEVKNDPVSMVRLQQLVALGFMPVLPQEEKKLKALRESLQKMQQKQGSPVVIQSGSAHRDWSVFKECAEKLGMELSLVEESADPNVKEGRRQALLLVLATESNILDLTKYPKNKQIALAQKLAPFGFKSMLSVNALKNEPITIASHNPNHALDSFEMALSQGFLPVFDSSTLQIVNQYYFDNKEKFRFITLTERDPKKLLAKMQLVLNLGFPVQIDEVQKANLRQYLEKQEKRPQLTLLAVNREGNKHNLQLAQDVGIKVDISGIQKESYLPAEHITVPLLYTQKGGGFFRRARRVPDLEGTIVEATRLASLGVRMKLSSEMLPLLKDAQAKVKAENEKNKGKKKPKYTKEGEAARNILEKFKILDAQMKKANTPASFSEFEDKTPIGEKAKVVSPYQNLQKSALEEAPVAPQVVVQGEPEKKPPTTKP